MQNITKITTALAAFASLGLASTPVATVSSSQPFTMDGHAVTTAGVNSWPVVLGDDLATATAPAVLYFRDGSSVKLSSQSSAKLGGSVDEPKLVLMSGTLDYKLVPGSKVAITNAAMEQQPDQPVITNASFSVTKTASTPTSKIASVAPILAGAAAAGAAFAVADAGGHGSPAGQTAAGDAGTQTGASNGPQPVRGTLGGTLSSPKVLVPASLVGGAGAGAGITNALITRLPPLSNFQ